MPTKKEKQPLSVTHPELAKEADGWDPKGITQGSNLKLQWICQKKHTWTTTANHRVRGQGCPFCSGRKILKGFNDLSTLFPELASQMVSGDPTQLTAGSTQKVRWRCEKNHSWETSVNSRTSSKSKSNGCPFCSGQKVLDGFNDLLSRNPEIALQADGWNPSETYFRSNKKLKWKCK